MQNVATQSSVKEKGVWMHPRRWQFALSLVLVAGALIAGSTPSAFAQAQPLSFGVRGGDYTNAGAAFIGAELLAPVGYGWWFNPNAEGAFVSHGHLLTGNFDFSYDIPVQKPFRVWLGGGPAIVFRS